MSQPFTDSSPPRRHFLPLRASRRHSAAVSLSQPPMRFRHAFHFRLQPSILRAAFFFLFMLFCAIPLAIENMD